MQDHVKIIGVLWIAFGALGLFGALVFFSILFGVSLLPGMGDIAPGVLRIVGTVISGFLVVLGAPKIIGGLGLLKRQEWARILILVISFISLLNIPFGTALGIYSLIVLLNPKTTAGDR